MSKQHLRRAFRRWHKRAGLFCAFFVLILSLTGIALNHSDAFKLAQKPVSAAWLLKAYGIELPEAQSFSLAPAGQTMLVTAFGKQLFVDHAPIYECEQEFVGVSATASTLAIACVTSVALFDAQLNMIDISDRYSGLPAQLERFGVCRAQHCASAAGKNYVLDEQTMHWLPSAEAPRAALVQSTPTHIFDAIVSNFSGADLTWERVVLDLHAGRFLGAWGPWLMDLVALFFIFLVVSGVYLWSRESKKKPKQHPANRH
ncbi:PepSY-associated TM helix domain-containing protein [Agaribacterium haliotis]|uniref:PepSY-associated TM helix domain-containing protein n=1 Tax=Agaribacterium haliotis TaxID=2013869 RepID=UPI000BB5487C|nr:PepSY-associated TM helix domain-containing protein [Agaribacterium haliotis]